MPSDEIGNNTRADRESRDKFDAQLGNNKRHYVVQSSQQAVESKNARNSASHVKT